MLHLARFLSPMCLAIFTVVSCFSAAVASAESAASVPERGVILEKDVVYGQATGVELKLDLARPAGDYQEARAVLLIHGGGWQAGDKKDFLPIAEHLAAQGFVAATINYRHAPQHRFPAQLEDAKCAVRWLRANAAKLKICSEKIGAIGASAGGHLAMMLGVLDAKDGLEGDAGSSEHSSKVQAVVNFFGPANLLTDYPPVSREIVKTFIGGSKDERMADYRRASPITYVDAGDAPMLIYQGTKDVLVPYDQATQMATSLTAAGIPGRVELLIGANHGWGGKELERNRRDTVDFLNQHLKP